MSLLVADRFCFVLRFRNLTIMIRFKGLLFLLIYNIDSQILEFLQPGFGQWVTDTVPWLQ